MIRKYNLYPDPEEHRKRLRRQRKGKQVKKIRIYQLKKLGFKAKPGTLWHTDAIILWWYGQRRVIFTALEDTTRLGYARVYSTSSSRNAKDFLQRLLYLSNGELKIIHSDNGSEFTGEFKKTCQQLGIHQIYSSVKYPIF